MLFQNSRNFWRSINRDQLLLLALGLGFVLRTLNSTFGSPSLYVSNDEAIAHLSAFNMIASKTPISIANYTPLGAYVQIPFLIASFVAMKIFGYVGSVSDFELFVLTHEGYFLFIPRLISAFFGTLTILVIYKLTLLLFGRKETAILGAFLTAVSFNLVHISHFGKPWSAALFFITLAIYLAIKKRILSSFAVAGTAYGFHQVGLLILPLLWTLPYLRKNLLPQTKGLFVFGFLFFIFNKLTLKSGIVDAISRGQSFLNPNTVVGEIISGKFSWQSIVDTLDNNLLGYFAVNFSVVDGVILIFGLWGIWKSMQEGQAVKILILFLGGYFIFASLFFHPLLRYLLPIIIIFIPFAALGLSRIKLPKVAVGIVLLAAGINSLWWNWLYLKTPTFIQGHQWINENIAEQVPVAYVGGRFQTFVPSSEAIRYMQTVSPNSYRRLESAIEDSSLDNVRNIIYVSKFPGRDKLERLRNATASYPVEYVVDYYLDPTERVYLTAPVDFEIIAKFYPVEREFKIPELLFDTTSRFPKGYHNANISKFSLERMGPYFEILKVKKNFVQ